MSATATLPDEPKAAPAGFTTVSASNLCDSSGNKITNATIYFQPVDSYNNWISYAVNNLTGQAMWESVQAQVTNGAFTVALADTSLTKPVNIGYLVTVIDNVSGASLLGPGYIIQPSGANWSFDSFFPRQPMTPTTQGVLTQDYFTMAAAGPLNVVLSKFPLMGCLLGLYYNGLMLYPNANYTLNGNQLTTTWSLKQGESVYALYFA